MPITTALDKFRLELGDTPAAYGLATPRPDPDPEFQAAALLNDGEALYFIAAHPSSVLLAVAAACDSLAVRFAQEVDEAEDGQSFKNSQRSAMYEKMGARLRKRALEETAAAQTGAGMPTGRVPMRQGTHWGEAY